MSTGEIRESIRTRGGWKGSSDVRGMEDAIADGEAGQNSVSASNSVREGVRGIVWVESHRICHERCLQESEIDDRARGQGRPGRHQECEFWDELLCSGKKKNGKANSGICGGITTESVGWLGCPADLLQLPRVLSSQVEACGEPEGGFRQVRDAFGEGRLGRLWRMRPWRRLVRSSWRVSGLGRRFEDRTRLHSAVEQIGRNQSRSVITNPSINTRCRVNSQRDIPNEDPMVFGMEFRAEDHTLSQG